jgi:hypothetical protein
VFQQTYGDLGGAGGGGSGGFGGGAGGTGAPGGTATPTTFSGVSVVGGNSYSIVVATGGQVVISWAAQ